MPLSAPAERELLHERAITLHGYQRADGLFDLEALLVDTKTYGFSNESRGWIEKGEPLHGLRIRLTVDEDMLIHGCEAASDHTPYAVCPKAAPNFARLAGLRIGPGFNRAVKERVGGVLGCTHLREVLGQVATVAYQTLYPVRLRKEQAARAARLAAGESLEAPGPRAHALLGTCIAYAPDSPVVLARQGRLEEEAPAGG